ncbi:alpha/beta fold hydrolase [Roseateles depolymerans]|uniref:BioH protein, putative n=1 Tax=Roseateles depolymerans TaxID=76731 RepID=A0A0U3MMC3_9BURK|nr:alpha/beta hydrolase [Roseateles depolymerans]ALV08620.1 BioH protein, putative [Roseateles depolymerans]REG21156.1 alpha-beta hydrolase superfamily lysophospholipase [Roseateles depolymerans]
MHSALPLHRKLAIAGWLHTSAMTRLVLLPGMDGTGELFDPFIAALHGIIPTSVVRYPAHLARYESLTAWASATLPTDEPYVLLGESFSGPIALTLAAERPTGLSGLILCASFARCPSVWLTRMRPALGWLPPLPPPRALLRHLLCNGDQASPETFAALQSAVSRSTPRVLLERLREVASVDVLATVNRIEVPLLYLHARQDRLVSIQSFQEIRRARPSTQLAEFDAPHLLLQTAPEATSFAVREFLDAQR